MKQMILLLSGVFSLILFSCKDKKPEKITRPVKIMEIKGNTLLNKSFPGVAEAEEYAFLTFRIPGMLQNFDIQEGENLKAGQIVGTLDPKDYNLRLSATKASYQQSQSQMERYKRLYEKNAVSKQDLEIAQARFENDKSIYNQALNDLEYTKLKAPFSGNVEKKFVENHQEITAGERIIKLNNPAKIQFRFTLPETNMHYNASDFKCSIELDVQKGVFYNAKIKEIISSSIDGSGIPVILKIDDPVYNPDKIKILPGYACNVHIEMTNKSDSLNTISIPLSCIYTDPENNRSYAWKVDKEKSVVSKTPVETGQLTGDRNIVILSGIKPGDFIVTAGVTMLSDGESIKILEP